jgi:hypothetical protein
MDFTKFIINGDNNGLKKYKEDGGDLNIVCLSFSESLLCIYDVCFCFHPFGVCFFSYTPPIFAAIKQGNKFAIDMLIDGNCDLLCRDARGVVFSFIGLFFTMQLSLINQNL